MRKTFYNYAYVDLAVPGRFTYPELAISFLFEPFYIGKGFGRRFKKTGGRNKWLKHKWAKLKQHWPIEAWTILFNVGRSEQQVLDEEIKTIAAIGRKDIGKGPLVNLTDGGETTVGVVPWNKGKSGHPWSPETREKMKARVPWNKGKQGIQSWTDEMREKASQQRKGKSCYGNGPRGKKKTEEEKDRIAESVRRVRAERFWSSKKKPMLNQSDIDASQ
jgi:hypothetical protein